MSQNSVAVVLIGFGLLIAFLLVLDFLFFGVVFPIEPFYEQLSGGLSN